MGVSQIVSSVRLSWPMEKKKQTYDFISVSIQKHDRIYRVRGMIVERDLACKTQHTIRNDKFSNGPVVENGVCYISLCDFRTARLIATRKYCLRLRCDN